MAGDRKLFESNMMKIRKQIYKYFWDILGHLCNLFLHLLGIYQQGYQNALDLQVKRLTLAVPNLPDSFSGYRLMIMSDLHIDGIEELAGIVQEKLNSETADICCLLGDYRWSLSDHNHRVLANMQKLLQAVTVRSGIYAIPGNHDDDDLIRQIAQLGVQILKNVSIPLELNSHRVWLIGIDDPHDRRRDDLSLALTNVPPSECKILLAHSPDIVEKAARIGIDLYLAGHTHGGQICLKRYGPIITNTRVNRRFGFGQWQLGNMVGYTTNGVGTAAIRVRFNCPPEILILTLIPA